MNVNGKINVDDYVVQAVRKGKEDGLTMKDMEPLFWWASTIDKTTLLSVEQWDELFDQYLDID